MEGNPQTPENRFSLYNSEWVKVEPIENPNIKPRPKSRAMRVAHPELYDFLMKRESAKKFVVGIIHIDHNGELSQQLKKEGKTEREILRIMIQKAHVGLVDIATKIKNEPSGGLAKVDFFTAFSRLAWAKRAFRKFGFEVFEMDEDEPMRFGTSSHEYVRKTRQIHPPVNPPESKNEEEKEAKIVLLSREKLLELYGGEHS